MKAFPWIFRIYRSIFKQKRNDFRTKFGPGENSPYEIGALGGMHRWRWTPREKVQAANSGETRAGKCNAEFVQYGNLLHVRACYTLSNCAVTQT